MLKEQIIETIKEVKPDIERHINSVALATEGVLDSLDIMNIISKLEDKFSVEFDPDDVLFENFDSINAITELIEHYRREGYNG